MKNKIEITRKQLEVFGCLILESEMLISEMINNNQAGPPPEEAKNYKGLCKKHEGSYWWNDAVALKKSASKAANVFSTIIERMNENEDA